MLMLLLACAPRLYTEGETDVVASWSAPTNDWPMGAPPAELAGEGWYEGEVAPDFRLVDQRGDEVSLWQFYGNVVMVDISTMWCAPCRDLAQEAQATQDEFAAQGFVYVTLLSENVEGEPPDNDDLNEWADAFGIPEAPVVSDFDRAVANEAVPGAAFPVPVVVSREMVVVERVASPTEEDVRAAIERAL